MDGDFCQLRPSRLARSSAWAASIPAIRPFTRYFQRGFSSKLATIWLKGHVSTLCRARRSARCLASAPSGKEYNSETVLSSSHAQDSSLICVCSDALDSEQTQILVVWPSSGLCFQPIYHPA